VTRPWCATAFDRPQRGSWAKGLLTGEKLIGEGKVSFGLRAEPAPPRGGPSRARWPCGERPEMTRKAIFSEGRTLCVRSAGPHECRGIPFSPADEPRGRLAYRAHASVKRKPTLRACGARPSAGLVIRARMALRGKAGNNVGGGFLGGARSPRP
jgi:hypothetical protein